MKQAISTFAIASLLISNLAFAQDSTERRADDNRPPSPDIAAAAERLGIDDEKRAQVREIVQAHIESVRSDFQESGQRPDREQMQANREQLRAELGAILDEQQLRAVERGIQSRLQRIRDNRSDRPTRPSRQADRI